MKATQWVVTVRKSGELKPQRWQYFPTQAGAEDKAEMLRREYAGKPYRVSVAQVIEETAA